MEDRSKKEEEATHEPAYVIASFPGLSAEGFERLKTTNPQCSFHEAAGFDRCTLAVSAGVWFGLEGSGVCIKDFERNKRLEKEKNLYRFKNPMAGDIGKMLYCLRTR